MPEEFDKQGHCSICGSSSTNQGIGPLNQTYKVDCGLCGQYEITDLAINKILLRKGQDEEFSPKCSYYVLKMQKGHAWPTVDENTIEFIDKNFTLPTPKEQGDNLIEYIGDKTRPGTPIPQLHAEFCYRLIGAFNNAGFCFVLKGLIDQGLIDAPNLTLIDGKVNHIQLTMNGWNYYQKLKRGHSESNKAFMAMPFQEWMIEIYEQFRQAVAETGFELNIVQSRTGLIDDHIRVDIRNARFIIADLTQCNRGAYWEAGYAEGLGKKVIYTCEKGYFEDKENGGTHFDTNHCKTVRWEKGNMAPALAEIKDIIRYEFPEVIEETSEKDLVHAG